MIYVVTYYTMNHRMQDRVEAQTEADAIEIVRRPGLLVTIESVEIDWEAEAELRSFEENDEAHRACERSAHEKARFFHPLGPDACI